MILTTSLIAKHITGEFMSLLSEAIFFMTKETADPARKICLALTAGVRCYLFNVNSFTKKATISWWIKGNKWSICKYWNTNKNLNTIRAIKMTKDIHVLAYMSNFCLFTNHSKNLTWYFSTYRRELSPLLPENI